MDRSGSHPARGGSVDGDRASDPWQPTGDLGDALAVRLLRAREAMMQFYRPLFRGAGINEQQWRVLRTLYAADAEPSVIARHAFMRPPNVSRVLRELEGSGLIRRTPAENDSRRTRIGLTDRGRALTQDVGQKVDDLNEKLRKAAGAGVLEDVGHALQVVIELPERLHPVPDTSASQDS